MATSLKTRRMLARGFNRRQAKLLGGRYFRGIGNRATLTTSLTGTNNDLTLIARVPGTGGNGISLRIVVSGANSPLSVSVVGSQITVRPATDGSSVSISTARDIRRAMMAEPVTSSLVWVQNAPQNDGTGVTPGLAATNLSGAS